MRVLGSFLAETRIYGKEFFGIIYIDIENKTIPINENISVDEIKKMVMRSLYTIFTKSEMCDVLNMSSAKYDQLMKDCGLSQTNGIDSENGLGDDEIKTALTANTIVALTDKCPEAIVDEDIDAANAIYFNTLNNAAGIYASALNGFDNSNEEKAIDFDKIYNVDMFAEIKGNARTRKIA